VGVGWQAGSCGTCEWCLRGEEHLCLNCTPTCVAVLQIGYARTPALPFPSRRNWKAKMQPPCFARESRSTIPSVPWGPIPGLGSASLALGDWAISPSSLRGSLGRR
jgi:hypothetical protein